MSEIKLKPCPFCGGKVYIDNEDCYGYEHIDFFVHCDNCSLQFGFASQFETEEEAAKAWNTRKPMDKVVKQLEVLREKAQKRREEFIELDSYNNVIIKNIEYERGRVYAFDDAIEVVKEGGKDGNSKDNSSS